MKLDRPALAKIVHEMNQAERDRLGEDGFSSILDLGKRWFLSETLRAGGLGCISAYGAGDVRTSNWNPCSTPSSRGWELPSGVSTGC